MAKAEKKNNVLVKANKHGKHPIKFLSFLRIFILPLYRLVRPFKVYGRYEPNAGAYIFVSNHYTMTDPGYILGATKDGVRFMAKKEIEKKPVFGAVAKWVKCIFVNRDGNDVRALLDCLKVLKNGEKLVIYAEGTRNKTDEDILPFKHGASALAIKTKTPVIPLVIYSKPKFFKRAHILMGQPIEFSEYYDKKLMEEDFAIVDEKIRTIMIEMKREHKAYLQSKNTKK